MKSVKRNTVILLALFSCAFTSCYTYTYSVGGGAKGNAIVKQKNNYYINGLIKGSTSDPKTMAGGSSDYNVKIQHSFGDYLLTAITLGIYSPTTTTITK